MTFDIRKALIWIAVVVFLGLGIGASFWNAARLEASASQAWLNEGRSDTARMTDSVVNWVAKLQIKLRAISSQFRIRNSLDSLQFLDLLETAKYWDSDVKFDNFAFAEWVPRSDRSIYEQQLGLFISNVGDARTQASDDEDHFVVALRLRDDGLIREHASLSTHPEMKETILTARRVPNEVVIGPAYKGANGDWYVAAAITTEVDDRSGVLLATLDLENFFTSLTKSQMPQGIQLRLSERDNAARAVTRLIPILGGLQAPLEAVATETNRITAGYARWTLNWDIMPNYLGGPAQVSSNLLRFGGSGLTLLMVTLFGFLSFQAMRFQRLVRERTAELSRHAMIIQLTMDSIDQGFVVWNADYRLVVWSKCCPDFWYKPQGILRPGMHMKELLEHVSRTLKSDKDDPKEQAEKEFLRITTAGFESEEVFTMLDGRIIHVRRFPLEKGGYVAVYTDITKQKTAEEKAQAFNENLEKLVNERTKELRAAIDEAVFANRSKSEFLANMSHELRTPLNAIIGFSQMLKDKVYGDVGSQNNHDYVNIINEAGSHLLRIIGDVLDLAKIEAGEEDLQEEVIDPGQSAADCIAMMKERAHMKGITVKLAVDNKTPMLKVDGIKLKQIMLNLLSNAIKFTDHNGKITTHLDIDKEGGVRIAVEDNGIGIAPEDISKVTNPFEQISDPMRANKEGSGLGLNLSKRLMELHGGRLEIESVLGRGTTVFIIFPASRNEERMKAI